MVPDDHVQFYGMGENGSLSFSRSSMMCRMTSCCCLRQVMQRRMSCRNTLRSLSVQNCIWTKARLNSSPQCPLALWMCFKKSSIEGNAASRMTGNLLHRITVALASRSGEPKNPRLSMKGLSCEILELADRQFFLVTSFISVRKECCWDDLKKNLKALKICSKVRAARRIPPLSATSKRKAIVLNRQFHLLNRVSPKSGFSCSSVGLLVRDTATCWGEVGWTGLKCTLCERNGGPYSIESRHSFDWQYILLF